MYFQLTDAPTGLAITSPLTANRQPVALGEGVGAVNPPKGGADNSNGGTGDLSDEDALQARLDALRRG